MNMADVENIAIWPFENLFYNYKWLHVLSDCYGFNFKAVMDSCDTPFMLFSIVEDIFGKRIISLPFSDYTELCSVPVDDIRQGLKSIQNAYPELPITVKLLGDYDFSQDGFVKIRNAVCHRIPLVGDVDSIWQRSSHAFRKGVSKALRSGLTFEICNTDEGLDIFYKLLVELRREKYRILPQSKGFYSLVARHFCSSGEGYICVVRMSGKPIASAMVLRSGSMLFDKMGVSDLAFQEYRPNNLLLWEVMKLGQSIGATALDMGLTQVDNDGLIKFKDSLGGFRLPIAYHRFVPAGFDETREQAIKKLLKQVTDYIISSDLDNAGVAEAGTMLYKYFC